MRKKPPSLGFVVILLTVGGAVTTGFGWKAHRDETRIARDGVEVTGTVLDKSHQSRRRRADDYYLHVEYVVPRDGGGERITTKFSVGRSRYKTTATGDTIQVRCVPDDSTLAKLAGDSDDGPTIIAIGVALLSAGAICGYIWKRRRDSKRVATASDPESWSKSTNDPPP